MRLREAPSGKIVAGTNATTLGGVQRNVLVWNNTLQEWFPGNASIPMSWGAAVATAGQFLVPGQRNLNSVASEDSVRWFMPRRGYLRRFRAFSPTTTTYTLRVNQVDTSVVLTSNNVFADDTTTVITVPVDQSIGWAISGAAGVQAYVYCEYLPEGSFTP